jgi:DNA-binding MarR family transcriptional regulator
MSAVVTALVRKGFVDQVPDAADQRQRVLTITAAGQKLWDELPDPIDLIQAVAFDGADQSELATALRVLQDARRGHGGGGRCGRRPAPASRYRPITHQLGIHS